MNFISKSENKQENQPILIVNNGTINYYGCNFNPKNKPPKKESNFLKNFIELFLKMLPVLMNFKIEHLSN